jgi:predicted permease
MIDPVAHDLRFAWRTLRRSPWLTAAAAVSLALGIGANTTVFTFVRALLLPPLRVQEARRLVSIYTRDDKTPYYLPNSYLNYQDYRRMNGVFADMAAALSISVSLGKGLQSERIVGEIVSGNYFSVLGVKPILGRAFLPEEDRTAGSHLVAVVTHGFWTRRFGRDPRLVGSEIVLDGHGFTVVGVAPEGFRGTAIGVPVELWVPMMTHPQVMSTYSEWVDQRRVLVFDVFGRLNARVGLKEAEAALRVIASRLEQDYPEANKGRTVKLIPLQEARLGPNARGVVVLTSGFLMVVVGLVLLIACVNLANLLLARTAGRRREIGIRVAVGASGGRLIQQLLTESLVLAFLGGALGLVFAAWATRLLWTMRPPSLASALLDLQLDGQVLLFTAMAALATGIAFGLAPALQASRADVVSALKDQGTASSGPRRFVVKNLLVVAQVCGSVVLLIVAALFVRSLQQANGIDPGFRVDDVVTMSLEPGLYGYGEEQSRSLYRDVVDRSRGLPGVRTVALAERSPMGGGLFRSVTVEGREAGTSDRAVLVMSNVVGPGYFEAVGIPLLRGRDFSERDIKGSPQVAIVNETMARRQWPGQSALGRRFKLGGRDSSFEVVGVARDSKYGSLGEDPQPFLYLPLEQNFTPAMRLHLRASGDLASSVSALRSAVQRVDENVPVSDVRTLRQQLSDSLWLPRMGAALLGTFGLLGMVLTMVGLYGVMENAVTLRTREMGIRMALGGPPRHVLAVVLKEGITLVGVGLGVGLAVALAVTRLLSRLLYGVGAADPWSFLAAMALLVAVGIIAAYVPAKAATRVDPMVALRYD